jgi:opacity protein-like surface antigen
MKRILVALSFAALAAPAFAAEVSAPFEQTQFDRGLAQNQGEGASGGSTKAEGVWAQDYNFVAPAQ